MEGCYRKSEAEALAFRDSECASCRGGVWSKRWWQMTLFHLVTCLQGALALPRKIFGTLAWSVLCFFFFLKPFLYGCDPPSLHITSFFLGMIHLDQWEINSFLFILDTWKELSMCRSMGLMVAFSRGQFGRSEGCTNDCKLQRHRYLVSLYMIGKHTRSIQLESEKVRVSGFPSAVSSAFLSSVCCGVWRGMRPLPGPSCDLLYCHSPPGGLNSSNLPSQWDVLWII